MFATTRQATAFALRGTHTPETLRAKGARKLTATSTAKPATALQPLRVANAAFISSSSKKPAQEASVRAVGPSNVKGNPGTPPPMKSIKDQTNVPLGSQEGNKGVVQYAL